jgi:hypothetical protein
MLETLIKFGFRFSFAFLAVIFCQWLSEPAFSQARLQPLDNTESLLYQYIAENQVEASAANRFRGGWLIYSKLNGLVFSHEPNSYLTARQMLLLQEVGRRFELPDLAAVDGRANANLIPFLYDSSYTGEPGGTISFWPIQDYSTGRRGVRPAISALLPIANIPNDFDTSSFAALWFLNTRQQPAFVRAFVISAGFYRDVGREVGRPEGLGNNLFWKRLNSGAFLTWADPDHTVSPYSRIPNGINTVDCVVNLNVLSVLNQYRKQGHLIPPITDRGMNATCRLVIDAVRSGAIPECSFYYDRASEFWWAYSQALINGASCLEPVVKPVRWRLLTRALEVARAREASSNGTEVAEILGALKLLYPPAARPVRVIDVVSRLDAILRGMVDNEGKLVTEDSISLSRGFGMQLEWFAPAHSSALALFALTIP